MRFDGTSTWNGLSSEAMEEIGSIALELVVAWNCQDRAYEDADVLGDRAPLLERAAGAADQLLIDQLRMAFVDYVDEAAINDATGFPLLPSRLGQVCRACGCSQLDACQPLSCSWVESDLCSACAAPSDAGAAP